MEQFQPMLAAPLNALQIEKRMEDPDYVGEVKFNGFRYIANFTEEQVLFTSRRTSVKDAKKVEKGDRIPHLSKAFPFLNGTVLDGEILTADFMECNSSKVGRIMGAAPALAIERQKKEGWVVYQVYDILFYRGKDIQSLPKFMRDVWRKRAIHEWENKYASFVYARADKEVLLSEMWEQGREGIILKHLKAPYTQDARDPNVCGKIKKKQTWDVVIMGYEQPEQWTLKKYKDDTAVGQVKDRQTGTMLWKCHNRLYQKGFIKNIVYGCYDKQGKLVQVSTSSGMSDSVRELLSKKGKHYIGTVCEVHGNELYKDAIIHPRFIKFRDDKDAKDCTLADLHGKRKARYE